MLLFLSDLSPTADFARTKGAKDKKKRISNVRAGIAGGLLGYGGAGMIGGYNLGKRLGQTTNPRTGLPKLAKQGLMSRISQGDSRAALKVNKIIGKKLGRAIIASTVAGAATAVGANYLTNRKNKKR